MTYPERFAWRACTVSPVANLDVEWCVRRGFPQTSLAKVLDLQAAIAYKRSSGTPGGNFLTMGESRTDGAASVRRPWHARLLQVLSRQPKTRSDLVVFLRKTKARGLLDLDELTILEGALRVADMHAREIMIPKPMCTFLSDTDELDTLLEEVIRSGHSRFPVLGGDESMDTLKGVLHGKDLLGILHAKDLLSLMLSSKASFDLQGCLRRPFTIPESMRLNTLLHEFRVNRNHMAIVVDEYSHISGLVTIEDVLEQIVGEIADEHDVDPGVLIRAREDNTYEMRALISIEDFNRKFGTKFVSDDNYETMGGIILHRLGRLPRAGEAFFMDDVRFRVLQADARRIRTLLVYAPKAAAPTDPEPESH